MNFGEVQFSPSSLSVINLCFVLSHFTLQAVKPLGTLSSGAFVL